MAFSPKIFYIISWLEVVRADTVIRNYETRIRCLGTRAEPGKIPQFQLTHTFHSQCLLLLLTLACHPVIWKLKEWEVANGQSSRKPVCLDLSPSSSMWACRSYLTSVNLALQAVVRIKWANTGYSTCVAHGVHYGSVGFVAVVTVTTNNLHPGRCTFLTIIPITRLWVRQTEFHGTGFLMAVLGTCSWPHTWAFALTGELPDSQRLKFVTSNKVSCSHGSKHAKSVGLNKLNWVKSRNSIWLIWGNMFSNFKLSARLVHSES